MSLMAWYPLNGDMKNYGLGDLNLNINSDPTFGPGILGQGLVNGGDSNWNTEQIQSLSDSYEGKLSLCFWIKPLNVQTGEEILFDSFLRITISNGTTLKLDWREANQQKFDLATIMFRATIENAFVSNKWNHFCITYNCLDIENGYGFATIYINGENVKTMIRNPSTQKTSFPFGNGDGITRPIISNPDRIMNDLRIYYKSLSPKEVKELSKCKIIHYPMNSQDGIVGGRNLWFKTKDYDTTKDSIWYVIAASNVPVTNKKPYTVIDGFGVQRLGTSTRENISQKCLLLRDTDYTLSAWVKWVNAPGSLYGVCDDWTEDGHYRTKEVDLTSQVGFSEFKRVSFTFNSGAPLEGSNNISSLRFESHNNIPYLIYGLKFEKGSVATPWTPAPEDLEGFIFNDDTVYDCSGYMNNGSYEPKNYPTWSSDSPVGSGSFEFKNVNPEKKGQVFISNFPFENLDSGTLSFKVNISEDTTVSNSYPVNILSITGNNDYNEVFLKVEYEKMNTNRLSINFCGYTRTMPMEKNAWVNVAITWDKSNYTIKFYINNFLMNTIADLYHKLDTYSIHHSNSYIGDNQTMIRSFYAKVCDFRVYSTALSQDDIIKDLVNNRLSILNNGSLLCSEYIENEVNNAPSFNSKGVITSGLLIEENSNVKIHSDSITTNELIEI